MTLPQYLDIASKGGRHQDIMSLMDKIRILYHFEFTTEKFLAGRDAIIDMKLSKDRHYTRIFEADKEGFWY